MMSFMRLLLGWRRILRGWGRGVSCQRPDPPPPFRARRFTTRDAMPRSHATRAFLFRLALTLLSPALVSAQAAQDAAKSQLLDRKLESALVPGPVEFYVLLPPGYSETGERYPLVIDLHGGGGSRVNLE